MGVSEMVAKVIFENTHCRGAIGWLARPERCPHRWPDSLSFNPEPTATVTLTAFAYRFTGMPKFTIIVTGMMDFRRKSLSPNQPVEPMATDTAINVPDYVLPVELLPDVDHLVTEDDTPVDGVFSEKQMRLLTEPLYSSWACPAGQRSFVAMANVGLFFDVNRPPLVPDVLLSVNVQPPPEVRSKKYRSYFVWQYGKPPDVVIEVVSNCEGGEDTEKLAAYARIPVGYYVIFDPEKLLSTELVRVYRLLDGEYVRMNEPIRFPKLGLGLGLWQGTYEDLDTVWLRWVNEEGILVPTGNERAEAERQRAEAERQRAERLAEQLRQLGVEPPQA
jgi:hypothetical protein